MDLQGWKAIGLSAGGIAKHAPNKQAALKFLEYLVSPQAQKYFADGNSEYPVVASVELSPQLKELGAEGIVEYPLNKVVY